MCANKEMIDTEMSSTCLQSGPAFNGYQANNIMHPQSPHATWQFTSHPKQQEEKNDSGINSGSDFQSSSPGSDNSQDLNPQNTNPRFYSTPLLSKTSIHPYNISQQHFNHNPLTPPNSEPLVSPKSEDKDDITLTPCASPGDNTTNSNISNDHLRRLEISLEKSGLFSSKVSEASLDDDNKSDDCEFDEKNLRVPRVNSHGKVKTFKCKQCNFIAMTKLEFWEHNKTHIKEEKQLTCPKCPFVTEYKHHLEYHLRNHTGSKPFKCNKCEYSCVNKSMLNSHMKSHSNIYRYRCIDCSYATKYCHSLKIHLRKYNHNPAVVLDSEGKPCPDLIIDVHGTRRGPKIKSQTPFNNKSDEQQQQQQQLQIPFGLNHLQQIPFPAYPFFNNFPNPQLLQNFQQLLHERQVLAAAGIQQHPESEEMQEQREESVLDLSKSSVNNIPEQKNRRKGPAFKLNVATTESDDDDDDDETTTIFSNVEAVVEERNKMVTNNSESEEETLQATNNNNNNNNNNNENKDNICQYCNIAFGDAVLYTIHMGYHGFKNPFSCNMCGAECADKVAFFLHIARTPHT